MNQCESEKIMVEEPNDEIPNEFKDSNTDSMTVVDNETNLQQDVVEQLPDKSSTTIVVPSTLSSAVSTSTSSFSSSSSSSSPSSSISPSPHHHNHSPTKESDNVVNKPQTTLDVSPSVVKPSSRTSTTSSTNSRKTMMTCEMCNNYEIQLQDVQYKEAVLSIQISQQEKNIKQLKEELKKEQNFRLELEDKYNDQAKKAEHETKDLSASVDEGRKHVDKLTIKFNKMEKQANDLVAELIGQIELLKKEIQRLAMDNEKLLGKHLKHSQELLSEEISLPQDPEQMQFYCLQLRENLIQSLATREHMEVKLKSENMFLKEQLRGEQQSKEKIEETFTQENEKLRTQLEATEIELVEVKKQLSLVTTEYQKTKENLNLLSTDSTAKVSELQSEVQDLSNYKSKMEEELLVLRNKVQSLQIELDNGEQVQKDFVKLSQSLQVQLEKIRQADTEVRWQHEDDVTECNSCKKGLNNKKEKTHCSHCGKIFCLDCNSKIIYSGPKTRPFKVCNVCHTLLNSQSACWFVNEAPQSPT